MVTKGRVEAFVALLQAFLSPFLPNNPLRCKIQNQECRGDNGNTSEFTEAKIVLLCRVCLLPVLSS